MIVNADVLASVYTAFTTVFNNAFKATETWADRVAMTVPALCQMLVRAVRDDTVRPTRKTGGLIRRLIAEFFRRDGYKRKDARRLARDLMEQEQ